MQNINIISNLKDKLKNYSQNYYHNLKTKNNLYSDKYLISSKNISYNDASVLILLFPLNDSIYFYLTKRTNNVEHHKGQISLPGGANNFSESLMETAIRETYEEIGVKILPQTIIGQISPLNIPVSGFCVHPFIAWCNYVPKVNFDTEEVDSVFSISLKVLINDEYQHLEQREFQGNKFMNPYFQFSEYKVWGATAMILSELKSIIVKIS